jgi:hypothetical protein
MAQTGPSPVIAQDYLQVDPFKAPTRANENERLSQGYQDPAFLYAWQQNVGLLPPAWEGDNATIDAVYAVCQKFKTPPAAPTLTTLSPNTAPANSPAFLMTCTGTGFAPGAIVLFGVAPETRVTVVSPTSLTVTVYPGYIPLAGTVNVAIKNGGGAAASATVPFTVT